MGQKTSILNSELAVKIMSTIASRTDGNYSTNIADELGKPQPSISRVLTDLHTIGLIDKGRREKVQYYKVDYEKISEYWLQQIREKLEEEEKAKKIGKLNQNSEKLKELAGSFFQNVLESDCSGMTVSWLLFDGFTHSLGHTLLEKDGLLVDNDCLKPALEGLKIYNQEKEFCGNIYTAMDQSIIETLE